MDSYYLLVFLTNTGQTTSIKIPYAKETPTVDELKAAMDRIVATGIVDVIVGDLVSNVRVDLFSVAASEYEV